MWNRIQEKMGLTLATVFGIGFVFPVGQGTASALAAVCLVPFFLTLSVLWQAIIILVFCAVGVWSSGVAERVFATKDDHRVVIDEFASVFIQFFALPMDRIGIVALVVGLVLNRVLDIAKPFGINRLQKWRGGWGIMIDDIAVGVLAQVAMRAFFFFVT